MKMRSVMPAAPASSTAYWMRGLSTIGSISLGEALVAGRKRVPRPATGKTAFVSLIMGAPSALLGSRRAPRGGEGAPASCSFVLQHLQKLGFVEHRDTQLAGLVALGSGLFAGDHITRLLRHGARDLAAKRFDPFLRIVARHRGEGARQHDNLTCEGTGAGRWRWLALLPAHARGAQLADHLAIMALAEEGRDRLGDDRPHVGRLLQSLDSRVHERIERAEMPREILGRDLT